MYMYIQYNTNIRENERDLTQFCDKSSYSHNKIQEKMKEVWLNSVTKAPTPTAKSKNNVTTQKSSITQRLRTDLE